MSKHKSTTDRILPGALRALGVVSPRLQAAVAAHLFLRTPPRRAPRAHARPVVERGRVTRLAGGRVVGEIWESSSAADAPARGTVLLLHGWGGRRTQLYSFVAPLRAAGYRVVAFDAPGHGDSPGASLSLILFAATIRRVAAEVGPLAAIIAHSFGGPSAALAIRDGLVVDRLVTIGAPADPGAWFRQFGTYLGLDDEARARVQTKIETNVGEPMTNLAIERFGATLRLPMLVIHDRLDGEVAYSAGPRIVAAAPGARLVTTEGLGHRRILRDEGVVQQVVDFVTTPSISAAFDAGRCRQCGHSTTRSRDQWEAQLCMNCGVEAMLQHPTDRWPTAA